MKFVLIIFFSLYLTDLKAASCCVANAGLPQLITLPAKWQITSQLSHSQVIADTNPKGSTVFRGDNNKEQVTTLAGSVAWAKGLWQLNSSFAWAQKNRRLGDQEASSVGASDPSVAVVREIPTGHFGHRIWSFLRHVFPAANSIYDSQNALATQSLGAGRPQTGLGALYVWNGRFFDAQMVSEIHLGHGNTRGQTHLGAQPGGSIGAGGGWVKKKWRTGVMLTSRFEGASQITQDGEKSSTSRIQVWDSNFSLGRQLDAFSNIAISYNDQTLFGPARNTTLTRSGTFLWQYRW
ncbi:MAG: hypothetical protein K2P81_17125 [Bacteriovoracaceae bacterium]|nr:hypothetical protein [Bacteriovoracaceae bacterium]